MMHAIRRVTLHSVVLVALAGLILLPGRLAAEPTPGTQDAKIARMVCDFLEQGHLTRPKLGPDISQRLFHRFLKDLDPAKIYFQKSDVDEFKNYQKFTVESTIHY